MTGSGKKKGQTTEAQKQQSQQARIRERREFKTREGKTIFYLPSRRDKLRERRASHRREYRKFMRKMVSELSKKVGRERLQGNKNKTRAALFTNSSFVNKLAALQIRQKHEFRIQWNKQKQAFLGTGSQDYITQTKKGDKLVCTRCNTSKANKKDFGDECLKGLCTPTKVTAGHTQARGHNTRKLKMYDNIKAMTANIRGTNSCGKRQILSTKWEKEGIDIALLSEVQKNTGGMEKEGH